MLLITLPTLAAGKVFTLSKEEAEVLKVVDNLSPTSEQILNALNVTTTITALSKCIEFDSLILSTRLFAKFGYDESKLPVIESAYAIYLEAVKDVYGTARS